jgi:hypothetical protein
VCWLSPDDGGSRSLGVVAGIRVCFVSAHCCRIGERAWCRRERLATALWITRQHPQADDETRATELTQIKPHVHRDAALAAVREIDGLLAEANALTA